MGKAVSRAGAGYVNLPFSCVQQQGKVLWNTKGQIVTGPIGGTVKKAGAVYFVYDHAMRKSYKLNRITWGPCARKVSKAKKAVRKSRAGTAKKVRKSRAKKLSVPAVAFYG